MVTQALATKGTQALPPFHRLWRQEGCAPPLHRLRRSPFPWRGGYASVSPILPFEWRWQGAALTEGCERATCPSISFPLIRSLSKDAAPPPAHRSISDCGLLPRGLRQAQAGRVWGNSYRTSFRQHPLILSLSKDAAPASGLPQVPGWAIQRPLFWYSGFTPCASGRRLAR